MRYLLGTCTLLLSLPGLLLAQTTGKAVHQLSQAAAARQVLDGKAVALSKGCPEGFAATRLPGQGLHGTDQSQDAGSEPTKASLDVSLPFREGTVNAQVRLVGLAGPTVLPIGAAQGSTIEDVFVTFHPGERKRVHGIARSVRLTGIQWVELQELTYGNGRVWHEASKGACRVAPIGYRLVDVASN